MGGWMRNGFQRNRLFYSRANLMISPQIKLVGCVRDFVELINAKINVLQVGINVRPGFGRRASGRAIIGRRGLHDATKKAYVKIPTLNEMIRLLFNTKITPNNCQKLITGIPPNSCDEEPWYFSIRRQNILKSVPKSQFWSFEYIRAVSKTIWAGRSWCTYQNRAHTGACQNNYFVV